MSTAGYTYDATYGSYDAYPHPSAAAYLSGPGSTASVGGYYAHSYAAENERGGIYTESSSYYGTNLTQVRSYSYSGADYSVKANDFYIDYQVQTPGSPLGEGIRYGIALPAGYGNLDSIDFYSTTTTTTSGSASYSATDGATTEQFSSGYTLTYHSSSTSESYGGHLVPGAGHSYSYATITDPSGDTTPFTGGLTGYYQA